MRVQLFIPCFVDQLYPETGMNMVRILEHFGCTVTYNKSQSCCGQPAYNAGFSADAQKVAEKFLNDFTPEEYIVTVGGSCAGYVRGTYSEFFAHTEKEQKACGVSAKMFEFTEFLTEVLRVDLSGISLPVTVTYHDACGALRECNIKTGPRNLLKQIDGLPLVEMGESETCCGFGGTFAVKFEAISTGMARTKAESALQTGASIIVSTDASCLMHLQAYIEKQGYPLRCMNIVDLLAMALFPEG